MSGALPVAAIGGKALWYLTRSSGLVALVLLSATIVLGVVASVGWTMRRWPRFLSQDIHRNISLLGIVFVAVHVVTTVADGYVPIGYLDAVIPFRSPYRPLYVGFGALAFDLLVAVLITSGLRHRIGFASWRFVHWLAYLAWPVAVVHALGTGTDTSLPVVLALEAGCTALVVGAVAWRIVAGREFPAARRLAAGVGTLVVAMIIAGFAALGPLRPGWSHRSGTSEALLAQIAAKNGSAASTTATSPSSGGGAASRGGASSTSTGNPSATNAASVPSAPFTAPLTGSKSTTNAGDGGNVRVTLAFHLTTSAATPLTVTLNGEPTEGGGVRLASGSVQFGPYRGRVTGLNGTRISAQVATPRPLDLLLDVQISPNSDAIGGTVTGTAAANQ